MRPLDGHFIADVIGRYNHDHAIAVSKGNINRVVKNTAIADDFVLLHGPKTTTRATRDDNCPDLR
jgi:stage V sporulation protein SpoVS